MVQPLIKVALEGKISVEFVDRCSSSAWEAQSGPVFKLGWSACESNMVNEVSSIAQTIDTNVFQALPVPTSLRGRQFYIAQMNARGAEYQLRFTYDDDTTETLTLTGTLLREALSDNAIKGVEIIGSGVFQWILAGHVV